MHIDELYTSHVWYCDEAEKIIANEKYREEAEKVMLFLQYYFPTYFPGKEPPLHIEMLMLSMFSKRNTALAVPRAHSKSTLLTFGLNIYLKVFLKHKYNIIASESHDKASIFVQRIRDELKYNKKLIKDFAPNKFETTDWAKSDFVTSTRIKTEAVGYGQSGRGLVFEDSRPDLVFYDDLETTENAGDVKMKDKFDSDLYPAIARANPNSRRIYVGTIINEGSLLADTLKDERWVRARYESVKSRDIEVDDITDDDMLAPMLYSAEDYRMDRIAAEKKGKLSIFMAENHNNPTIKDESAVFFRKSFKYYKIDDIRRHLDSMNIYMSIDPAISKSDRADYTVITTVAVNSDNIWYVLNQKWGRWNPSETVDHIFSEAKVYKPEEIIFETIAYQQALKLDFESKMISRNSWYSIKEAKRQNKEIKIQQLEPRYRMNTIYHPENDSKFVRQLEAQLLGFRPELKNFGLTHDDMIDSLSMIHEFAIPPSDVSGNSEKYIGHIEEESANSYIIN